MDWVLRSLYGFASAEVGDAFRKLAGLPAVHREDPLAVVQALAWLDAGIDFADGLHLASRGGAKSFVTFDVRFVKKLPGETWARVYFDQQENNSVELLASFGQQNILSFL